jgi:hypothetical protein
MFRQPSSSTNSNASLTEIEFLRNQNALIENERIRQAFEIQSLTQKIANSEQALQALLKGSSSDAGQQLVRNMNNLNATNELLQKQLNVCQKELSTVEAQRRAAVMHVEMALLTKAQTIQEANEKIAAVNKAYLDLHQKNQMLQNQLGQLYQLPQLQAVLQAQANLQMSNTQPMQQSTQQTSQQVVMQPTPIQALAVHSVSQNSAPARHYSRSMFTTNVQQPLTVTPIATRLSMMNPTNSSS